MVQQARFPPPPQSTPMGIIFKVSMTFIRLKFFVKKHLFTLFRVCMGFNWNCWTKKIHPPLWLLPQLYITVAPCKDSLSEVLIFWGTQLLVLRDWEHVLVDFLPMATPHVVGMVLPVEASTRFRLEGRVGVPFLPFADGFPITLRTNLHRKEVITC